MHTSLLMILIFSFAFLTSLPQLLPDKGVLFTPPVWKECGVQLLMGSVVRIRTAPAFLRHLEGWLGIPRGNGE